MNFVPLFFALLVEPTRPFVLDILVLEPVALRVLGDKVLHNRVIQYILQSVSYITANITAHHATFPIQMYEITV